MNLILAKLIPFFKRRKKLSYTYNGTVQSGTDQSSPTTHNLGTISYGTPAAGRIVVAVIQMTFPDGAPTITGVNIGGGAATIHAQQAAAIANGHTVMTVIASRIIPTGSSGAVTITFSAGKTSRNYRTSGYSIYGAASNAAFASNTSTASNPSMSLNAPSGGVVIAAAGASGSSPNPSNMSWSAGLTRDQQGSPETSPYTLYSSASKLVTATGSQAAVATITGTKTSQCGVAVSWAP